MPFAIARIARMIRLLSPIPMPRVITQYGEPQSINCCAYCVSPFAVQRRSSSLILPLFAAPSLSLWLVSPGGRLRPGVRATKRLNWGAAWRDKLGKVTVTSGWSTPFHCPAWFSRGGWRGPGPAKRADITANSLTKYPVSRTTINQRPLVEASDVVARGIIGRRIDPPAYGRTGPGLETCA